MVIRKFKLKKEGNNETEMLNIKVIQVTLDGSNSDLSKFSISRSKAAVPFFFSI